MTFQDFPCHNAAAVETVDPGRAPDRPEQEPQAGGINVPEGRGQFGPAQPGSAFDLGATLYVPIIHPSVASIVAGDAIPALRSVVLCLEDALLSTDVERGMAALAALLLDLLPGGSGPHEGRGSVVRLHVASDLAAQGPRTRSATRGPLLFVRPRSLEMARRIADLPGIEIVDGFVAPKIDLSTVESWWRVAGGTGLRLMPTLETAWVFDSGALRAFADALEGLDPGRLVALRVGGNDLLGLLGLRRQWGRTAYEGPLLAVLAQVICQLGARGLPLTAPVFDILDDPRTLEAESRHDADFGFVGKTAIHPSQIPIITRAFSVSHADLAAAEAVLDPAAPAVFRHQGRMLEPATHRAWARQIVQRATSYGMAPAACAAE